MNFASDNVAGAAPEIVAAIAEAATAGKVTSYGADPYTARLKTKIAEVFEHDVEIFPVATGTAANALTLAALSPPWGEVYCHRDAHIVVDECGAPEFYTGGGRMVGLDGPHGRIDVASLGHALRSSGKGDVHHMQPGAVSLSQATEAGTVYRPADVAAVAELAHAHGLKLHMDGARFANALAHLNSSPAEASWKAGVDVLCLGGTKGGCVAAEVIIVFEPKLAAELGYRRKRAGHLVSKMRFLSAQLVTWLDDGLWLKLAAHANAQAARLSQGLTALPGVSLRHPVEANETFVDLPPELERGLRNRGAIFGPWPDGSSRFVTAFDTDPSEVDRLLAEARELARGAA